MNPVSRTVARAMLIALTIGPSTACTHAMDTSDSAVPDAAADVAAEPDATPDDATPDDATPTRAAFPQVMNRGGPVLSHVQLVAITFANDPNRAALHDFNSWIVGSHWLTTVGAEYGVGAGTLVGNVDAPDAAPAAITDAQIAAYLTAGMQSGALPAPSDHANNEYLYAVYYPATTTVHTASGAPSCVAFQGYHHTVHANGYRVAYAVIPSCADGNTPGLTGLEAEQQSASHEIIETLTDPYVQLGQPAYAITHDATNAWSIDGGEIGDLCFGTAFAESGFHVQRVWSNAAAAMGGDPCVPAMPGQAYFNVAPATNDAIMLDAGASTTLTLTGWSTATVASWQLDAEPAQGNFMPTATLRPATANAGRTTTLTITVPAGTPSGSYSIIEVYSTRDYSTFNFWPVAVVVN